MAQSHRPEPNGAPRAESRAPSYKVPARQLGALEHPMIINNLDKGLKTLGASPYYPSILEPRNAQVSMALHLRPDNPTVRPVTSHNAASHNIVLKVTVPKRTGRKRKRGSDDPYEGDAATPETHSSFQEDSAISSVDGRDEPLSLRRKLQDTAGRYEIEPAGVILNTHRFRALADFQYSTGRSAFMSNFVDTVLSGQVSKMRQFKLSPGVAQPPGVDIIPPPLFAPISLPFNFGYQQNPFVAVRDEAYETSDSEIEYEFVYNKTAKEPDPGYFISQDHYPVPTAPKIALDRRDNLRATMVAELLRLMDERPIWTRRSIVNRILQRFGPGFEASGTTIRQCIQYAGYQFKGGPWRDALVRYGLDPRNDPSCAKYQTLIFKLHRRWAGSSMTTRSWHQRRKEELRATSTNHAVARQRRSLASGSNAGGGEPSAAAAAAAAAASATGTEPLNLESHIFDGTTFAVDGKVWQVCDITDPLLQRILFGPGGEAAATGLNAECDVAGSGWFPSVRWAVAKAVMKCKMLAIKFGRALTDADFAAAMALLDDGGDGGGGGGIRPGAASIGVPLPDLGLTPAEKEEIRGYKTKVGRPLLSERDRSKINRPTMHLSKQPRNAVDGKFKAKGSGKREWGQRADEADDDDDAQEESEVEDVLSRELLGEVEGRNSPGGGGSGGGGARREAGMDTILQSMEDEEGEEDEEEGDEEDDDDLEEDDDEDDESPADGDDVEDEESDQ